MSVGAGIFWSTVLLLTAAAIYQISVRKKWKPVGKVSGALILLASVLGGAAWGWSTYQSRPTAVTELNGVRLGMTPLEVKLAMGKPIEEHTSPQEESGGKFRMGWSFRSGGEYSEEFTTVLFFGDSAERLIAEIICERGGYSSLLGVGRFTSEKDVIEKLGSPTGSSIHKDGLTKLISYKPWKVAFGVEKGKINEVCVTDSGEISYKDEVAPPSGEEKPASK